MEEGHLLAVKLHTKPGLDCGVPMESQFFTCSLAGRDTNICGVCGLAEAELLEPPPSLLNTFSKVWQLCTDCKAAGHEFPHGKKKANADAVTGAAEKKRKRQERSAGSKASGSASASSRGRGRGRGSSTQ